MVEEARLERLEAGLTPVSDGWFVVNAREGAWVTNEALGAAFIVEGDDVSFPDVGYTLMVIQPGQPAGMYHREANQEDFLVLAGRCLLLIEGEERLLRAWVYPRSEPALRHGAGVETETTSPPEAYARFPKWELGASDEQRSLPW
jgi:hypothetical protein